MCLSSHPQEKNVLSILVLFANCIEQTGKERRAEILFPETGLKGKEEINLLCCFVVRKTLT